MINLKDLKDLRLASNEEDEPIEIVVALEGEKDKAALRYYVILEANTNNI